MTSASIDALIFKWISRSSLRGAQPQFDSNKRLAAPRGEHDNATLAVSDPGIQGLVLVVPQLHAALQLGAGQEIEDLVFEVEAGCLQEGDDVLVVESQGTVGLGAIVPGGVRDADVSLDEDGSFVEGEFHGRICVFSLVFPGKICLDCIYGF